MKMELKGVKGLHRSYIFAKNYESKNGTDEFRSENGQVEVLLISTLNKKTNIKTGYSDRPLPSLYKSYQNNQWHQKEENDTK